MHEHYLKQALALAEIRRGFCSPNPAVGAVIVKDNQILATGYHYASGHPHAEVEAIKNYTSKSICHSLASGNDEVFVEPLVLNGATIYITLEPCCHFGKTPPCTDLLIKSGIKRVIYSMRDPNPQVANKSEIILKEAGIETIYLPLAEITEFYKSYNYWWQTKRPYVTAKIAMSLDGKIAGENGRRINITGEVAKLFTHQQRKQADAILTTAKTIICDDPLLNVRLADESFYKPIYILDGYLRTPLTAKIFNNHAPITIFHKNSASTKALIYADKGITTVAVNEHDEHLNLNEILQYIGQAGVHDLWIEAGGKCFANFIQQQLVQRTFVYVAPTWLGDRAQTAFTAQHDVFAYAKTFKWQALGRDAMCEFLF